MERGCVVFLMLACFIFTTIHLRAIHADEVDALITFKTGLSDPHNALQSWDPTLDSPCTWSHVTCDNDKVQRIDMGNLNLTGPLVPDLADLTGLQYLELYDNNINGPIPKEIGNLANLVSLDLYSNNLNDDIPEELGKLTNLRFLRLNDNKLTGPLPDAIKNLLNIQVLNVSNNPGMCGYPNKPLCL